MRKSRYYISKPSQARHAWHRPRESENQRSQCNEWPGEHSVYYDGNANTQACCGMLRSNASGSDHRECKS